MEETVEQQNILPNDLDLDNASLCSVTKKLKPSHLDTINECSSEEKSRYHSTKKHLHSPEGRMSLLSRLTNDLENLSKEQFFAMMNRKANQDAMCLIHQKSLDIVCLKDQSVICASCAIFGHKGHYFKSLKEFQQQKLTYCQKIVETQCRSRQIKEKIASKQTKQLILQKFVEKKKEMVNCIQKQYSQWHGLLEQSQNSSIEAVTKYLSYVERSVLQRLTIPLVLENQYSLWNENAEKQIETFDSPNIQNQIKIMNYMKKPQIYDIHQNGEIVLKRMEMVYNTTIDLLKKEIENAKLNINTTLSSQIKAVSQKIVENPRNCFNEIVTEAMKSNSQSLHSSQWAELPVEDLLIQDEVKMTKIVEIDQNRGEGSWDISGITPSVSRNRLISEIDFTSPPLVPKIQSQLYSPTKCSINRSVYRSQIFSTKSKTSLKSPRGMVSSIKYSASKSPRSTSQQKYDKLIDEIIKVNSHTLDLDNAQLGDIKLMKILQRLRCVKITTAILSKNKLTDAFVQKMWALMPHIETINLSNNLLTDKILNNILTTRRLQKNKNLILLNNKIKQKEVRFKIEALHRLGVNIQL